MTQVLTPARTREAEPQQVKESSSLSDPSSTTSILSVRAGLLLALVLPLFALAPLLYPGYFLLHSGLVPLWHVADLRAHLGELAWLPHLAVGFDPLRGTGLLPYYLAALLPLSPAAAVKGVMGGSWLLGSLGMYLWLRPWWGASGAVVAATVYTYLPYHLGVTYVRGAWGESLFWGLFPWALLLLTGVTPSHKKLVAAAACWLLLGLSQLGLAGWGLIFSLVLLFILYRSQALLPMVAALLGLLGAIGVYLMIPPHTLFVPSLTVFTDHFLYPFQLFSAFWGFGASRAGWQDGLSFQIGLAALGLAFLGIFLWQRAYPQVSRTEPRLLFFLAAAVFLSLLQFAPLAWVWSLPLWPGQDLAATLTYPWQLLGFVGLSCAVLAGATFWLDGRGMFTRLPLFASLLIFILLSVYPYLLPQFLSLQDLPLDRPEALLGEAQLALLKHDFTVVSPAYTAGLGQTETALPLAVYGSPEANDTLVLRVTWQPLQTFDQDLKVFVHLVDSQDNILAQFDGQPREGAYPTSRWIPGELIEDRYPLLFPAEAPPGPYRVFAGLYDEATLLRLPVPDDPAGRVIFEVQ